MKKLLALLLVLGTVFSLAACGARDLDAPAGYKQASNDEYCDYVFYVPSAWNGESRESNMTTASIPVGESGLTVSVAKLEMRYDVETLEDYWDTCKAEYKLLMPDFAVVLPRADEDTDEGAEAGTEEEGSTDENTEAGTEGGAESTETESEGETVLLGTAWTAESEDGTDTSKQRSGYRYTFTGSYGATNYTFSQVFAINGGDIYCITLTVKTAHYTEEVATTFNDMLSYFFFK